MGKMSYVHPGDSLGPWRRLRDGPFGDSESGVLLDSWRSTRERRTGGDPMRPRAGVMGNFNLLTAASMYYFVTETGQGDFTFGDGDAMIAFAKANAVPVHCHHLIGPNSVLPSWVVNGKFTADQLTQIMKTHIQTVMGHFKGQCASWDVVNEALNSDGTVDTTSANIWGNTIGPSYIDIAFQTARETDPGPKLYYNDFYIEDQTPKTAGLYTLLAGMQQRGTPIDGVGLESNWIPGNSDPNWLPNLESLQANMAQLAKLGLTARISELDARELLPASVADLTNQASIFSTTVQACLNSPNCVSMTVWGATDATSWINSVTFPGYGAATMFDANFQPKPAYTSVMNTLRTAALAVTTAPTLTATAVVNAASYAKNGVAPGEIVTLFPNNVGPATLTGTGLDASGKVLTEVAETRVLFDGIAAPIIYATKNQVAAVVPYEIAGRESTEVQVEYKGIQSVAVSVPVLAAVPGIITINSQGTGEAVALNQDGKANSAANPAARGTIVTLYATGEGQRNPGGVTGALSGSQRRSCAAREHDGGRLPAHLTYAASAPGFCRNDADRCDDSAIGSHGRGAFR